MKITVYHIKNSQLWSEAAAKESNDDEFGVLVFILPTTQIHSLLDVTQLTVTDVSSPYRSQGNAGWFDSEQTHCKKFKDGGWQVMNFRLSVNMMEGKDGVV